MERWPEGQRPFLCILWRKISQKLCLVEREMTENVRFCKKISRSQTPFQGKKVFRQSDGLLPVNHVSDFSARA